MNSSDTETTMNSTPSLTKQFKKRQGFGGGNTGSGKISEQDKQLIISLFAAGNTVSEVVERAREEFNIVVSIRQVYKYTQTAKWQPLIKKIRQETMNDLTAVAGSHKRVRLERGEKIYEKAMQKNKLDIALKATEHQRKEMEGDGDFSVTMNQYNLLSDEELEFKRKEVMERIARQSKGVITLEQSADKAEATGS